MATKHIVSIQGQPPICMLDSELRGIGGAIKARKAADAVVKRHAGKAPRYVYVCVLAELQRMRPAPKRNKHAAAFARLYS